MAGIGAAASGSRPPTWAVLKNGHAKAVRFATIAALCEVLECQPGELLRWEAADDLDCVPAQDAPVPR